MQIQPGTRLTANFGAMHPVIDGIVVYVDGDVVTWDSEAGDEYNCTKKEIHPDGWRSINGSPIGIFFA